MPDRYGTDQKQHPLRFLLSWEWVGYFVLVTLFAIATWGLSQWQFARRDEALTQTRIINTNYNAKPVTLDAVVGNGKPLRDVDQYRAVKVRGHYEIDHTLVVRNRPFSGNAGFEVIVPLRMNDGRRIVIDRGWIPVGKSASTPSSVPPAPAGEVTVIARLKQFEPTLGRTAPKGQLPTIEWAAIAAQAGGEKLVNTAYGLVETETPTPATAPHALPKPDIDEGPHLSYALQWIGFGIMAFLGLFWAIRRTRQKIADAGGDLSAAKAPAPPQQRKRNQDELFEDSVLEHRND